MCLAAYCIILPLAKVMFFILDFQMGLTFPSFLQSFGQLWDDITQDLLHRRQWIREMDETLNKYEVDRAEKVSFCLLEY